MAIVEVLEVLKDTTATVVVGASSLEFRKAGTYKIHASGKPELLVYDGQVEVTVAGQMKVAKKGNAISLENALVSRKFDTEKGDALLRWSMRRSGYMAMANVSAASTARSSGMMMGGGGMMGGYGMRGAGMGGWYWNPYYMMYTYLPYRGMFCNSYIGTCYYSPDRVQQAFYAQPVYSGGSSNSATEQLERNPVSYGYNQNLGYSVASGDRSYSGVSSASASAGAPAAAAPAASSGEGRSGADSGGRGSDGGGRAQ
jgi:hypothetical protein